jgi:hypothetical protein
LGPNGHNGGVLVVVGGHCHVRAWSWWSCTWICVVGWWVHDHHDVCGVVFVVPEDGFVEVELMVSSFCAVAVFVVFDVSVFRVCGCRFLCVDFVVHEMVLSDLCVNDFR